MTAVAVGGDDLKAIERSARHRATAPPGELAHGCTSGKQDHLRWLRKIEGQVRGLQKMIEAETWCPDGVTQVAPATRALQEVAVGLPSDHLRQGVMQAVHSSLPKATRPCWRPPARSTRWSGSNAAARYGWGRLIPPASRPSAGAADGASGRRRLPGVRSSARAGSPGIRAGVTTPGGYMLGL
jgi:DNA-binding FrmR family transcriptional regulator